MFYIYFSTKPVILPVKKAIESRSYHSISLGCNLILELLILVWGCFFDISKVILLKQDYLRLYYNNFEMAVF